MHKQTNRFLLRTELRKLAKWLQPLRRRKACSQPAWAMRVCLCASESVYGLALSGSHYGTFEHTCADSNGSGSTQGSKRRWSGPRKKMSDWRKEEWGEREREGRQRAKRKRQKQREEKERERTRTFGLHPSSIICLSCRCGRKEGREKNLHKVIIIHMNADQILENCKHTHTHKHMQVTHSLHTVLHGFTFAHL